MSLASGSSAVSSSSPDLLAARTLILSFPPALLSTDEMVAALVWLTADKSNLPRFVATVTADVPQEVMAAAIKRLALSSSSAPSSAAATPAAMQVRKFEIEEDCVLGTGSGQEKCRLCIDIDTHLPLTLPARDALRLGCVPYLDYVDRKPAHTEEVRLPDGRTLIYCAMSSLIVEVPLPATLEGAPPTVLHGVMTPDVLQDDLKECEDLLAEAYRLQKQGLERASRAIPGTAEGASAEGASAAVASNKKRAHDDSESEDDDSESDSEDDAPTRSPVAKLVRAGTADSASSTAAAAAADTSTDGTGRPPLSTRPAASDPGPDPRYVPVSPLKAGSGQPSFVLGVQGVQALGLHFDTSDKSTIKLYHMRRRGPSARMVRQPDHDRRSPRQHRVRFSQ